MTGIKETNVSPFQFPKIRPVEAIPVMDSGRQLICLRDPQNIARNVLSLPLPAYFLVTMLDGKHSVVDMQEAFMRQFRELIPTEKIENIIHQLDTELFLESENYFQALEKIKQAFRDAPYREPAHAGLAYESEPASLRNQLNDFFQMIENDTAPPDLPADGSVSVLVAPHIDLNRGSACYAHAYREIAKRPPSDLYIIFGTAHQSRKNLITLTRKWFNTPLGTVETDEEFVERFSQSASIDLFEEELLHRDEHSIEFQVLFLKYIFGDQWQGKIVPILSGSFNRYIQNGDSPREDARMAELMDSLRTLIENYDGSVTLLAGADMSHVGKKFGHSYGIPPNELDRVKKDDQKVLEAMINGDAEKFYRSVECQKDYNNVCGLSPIYMALDVARPSKGHVLKYDQAIDHATESVVSFASVSYYSPAE